MRTTNWREVKMKTILDPLGMLLRVIAVLISLIVGAFVLLIAGLLGKLRDSDH
jgi:hypothetical protein